MMMGHRKTQHVGRCAGVYVQKGGRVGSGEHLKRYYCSSAYFGEEEPGEGLTDICAGSIISR